MLDTTELAYPEVSKGVAWMDENRPDWFTRIDPETLDLSSIKSCVACQVAGIAAFDEAIYRLHLGYLQTGEGRRPDDIGMDLPMRYVNTMNCGSRGTWWASADRLWKYAAAERVEAARKGAE